MDLAQLAYNSCGDALYDFCSTVLSEPRTGSQGSLGKEVLTQQKSFGKVSNCLQPLRAPLRSNVSMLSKEEWEGCIPSSFLFISSLPHTITILLTERTYTTASDPTPNPPRVSCLGVSSNYFLTEL